MPSSVLRGRRGGVLRGRGGGVLRGWGGGVFRGWGGGVLGGRRRAALLRLQHNPRECRIG